MNSDSKAGEDLRKLPFFYRDHTPKVGCVSFEADEASSDGPDRSSMNRYPLYSTQKDHESSREGQGKTDQHTHTHTQNNNNNNNNNNNSKVHS